MTITDNEVRNLALLLYGSRSKHLNDPEVRAIRDKICNRSTFIVAAESRAKIPPMDYSWHPLGG